MWITFLTVILWIVYLFFKQANSQNIKIMLIFIFCVILARIIITPIVTILIQHHDRLKDRKEQERKDHEQKN